MLEDRHVLSQRHPEIRVLLVFDAVFVAGFDQDLRQIGIMHVADRRENMMDHMNVDAAHPPVRERAPA